MCDRTGVAVKRMHKPTVGSCESPVCVVQLISLPQQETKGNEDDYHTSVAISLVYMCVQCEFIHDHLGVSIM